MRKTNKRLSIHSDTIRLLGQELGYANGGSASGTITRTCDTNSTRCNSGGDGGSGGNGGGTVGMECTATLMTF